MEARCFTRCLRTRPTRLAWPQSSQPGLNQRFVRHNSSNNTPTDTPTDTATPSAQPRHEFKQPSTSRENRHVEGMRRGEFDNILGQLNLGGSNTGPSRVESGIEVQQTTAPARQRHQPYLDRGVPDYSTRPRPKPNDTPGPEMKLGPSLGRAVAVAPERRMDLNQALRVMGMNAAGNKLKATKAAQKFYVRGGQKRKELKSQRWRKLFRFSFQSTCQRVNRLAAQGW